MCILSTCTLVLKRKTHMKFNLHPSRRVSSFFKVSSPFSLSPSSLSGPVQLSRGHSFAFVHALLFLKDEGMSFISLYEKPGSSTADVLSLPPRSPVDPSNQSSQLPLKFHHFPSSQIDVSLIYLKVSQSDFP